MKVNRKFLRSAERLSLSAIAKDSAAQRVVSAVTAIGFVLRTGEHYHQNRWWSRC